ncbi:hypothetical protein RND81_09G014900, partial [Saponaria officinalis]
PNSQTNPNPQVNPNFQLNPNSQINPNSHFNPNSQVNRNSYININSHMNLNSHVNPNFLENVSSQPNSNSQLDSNYNYNFTELISNNQDLRNTDIFGNPINLSQPPNQPTRRRVTSSSRKNPPTSTPPTNIQNNLSTGWRDKEDEALMSAWIQCSEDAVRGKNQTTVTRWDRVMSLYKQSQQENPTEIGIRSLEVCKNRQKRLNIIVNKWVSCW